MQSVHLTQPEDKQLWEYVTKVQGIENPECWFCTDGVLEVARDGPKSITRRIGDSQTGILNLDTTGVTVPETPDAILESSVFELRQCPSPLVAESDGIRVEYPIYESLYVDLGHVVLKHWYVMPLGTGPSVMHKKCAAILKKLERLTRLELKKIPEAERPPEYYAFQRGEWDAMHLRYPLTGPGLTLPATWTYYDDEILADLQDAWESRDEVWEGSGQDRRGIFGWVKKVLGDSRQLERRRCF